MPHGALRDGGAFPACVGKVHSAPTPEKRPVTPHIEQGRFRAINDQASSPSSPQNRSCSRAWMKGVGAKRNERSWP